MENVKVDLKWDAPTENVETAVWRLVARLRFELTHQDVRPDARALRDKLDLISKELTGIIAKQAEATSHGGRGWLDVFASDPERASWLIERSDATASATSPDGHAVKSYMASGGTIEKKLLPGRFTTPFQKLERRVAALESIELARGSDKKKREVEHG